MAFLRSLTKTYLTKSRFQIGMECPIKLYYHLNSNQYANQKLDDTFLAALAKGGFQVGALAQEYYPDVLYTRIGERDITDLHQLVISMIK